MTTHSNRSCGKRSWAEECRSLQLHLVLQNYIKKKTSRAAPAIVWIFCCYFFDTMIEWLWHIFLSYLTTFTRLALLIPWLVIRVKNPACTFRSLKIESLIAALAFRHLLFLTYVCVLICIYQLYIPSVSSVPNTNARAPDTLTQCSSESSRRLLLINAASTPTIAKPSHRATTEGWLSRNRATTSPSAQPCPSAQWATAWHRSWSSRKVHTWGYSYIFTLRLVMVLQLIYF